MIIDSLLASGDISISVGDRALCRQQFGSVSMVVPVTGLSVTKVALPMRADEHGCRTVCEQHLFGAVRVSVRAELSWYCLVTLLVSFGNVKKFGSRWFNKVCFTEGMLDGTLLLRTFALVVQSYAVEFDYNFL